MEQGIQPSFQKANVLEAPKTKKTSVEEVLKRGFLPTLRLKVSEFKVSYPINPESIIPARQVLKEILQNEKLLKQFVRIQDPQELAHKHIPALLKKACANTGVSDSEDAIQGLAHAMRYSDSSLHYYVENVRSVNLYDAICEYANAYFATKYILEITNQAKEIIRNNFPRLYREFPFTVGIIYVPNLEGATHEKMEDGVHQLKLYNSDHTENQGGLEDLKTEGWFEKGYKFSRKTINLVTMLHEYAHGIYSVITNPNRKYFVEGYYQTADAALNEGFAVMLELLSCDKLIERTQDIGLTEQDVKDLLEFKRQRIRYLHRSSQKTRSTDAGTQKKPAESMAYTEGVIRFMHKIYKKGGVEGMVRFLESIDSNKTTSLLRSSQAYHHALGKPNEFMPLFTRAANT